MGEGDEEEEEEAEAAAAVSFMLTDDEALTQPPITCRGVDRSQAVSE